MTTYPEVTVKSSGGDYTSMELAESGEKRNIVVPDEQLDVACYSFEDITAMLISGIWVTGPTNFLRFYAPESERHSGTWDATKQRLVVAGYPIQLEEDYVRFEHLQIKGTGSFACIYLKSAIGAASDIRIDSCILRRTGSGTASTSSAIYMYDGNLIVRNSLIIANLSYCIAAFGVTLDLENVALIGGNYAIRPSSCTVTATNAYCGGQSVRPLYSATGITFITCAHSSADVYTGSTASIAYSTDNFTNVTSGSEDLTLKAGSATVLKSGGTDKSSDYTTDITGATWTTWGVGAFAFATPATDAAALWHGQGGL